MPLDRGVRGVPCAILGSKRWLVPAYRLVSWIEVRARPGIDRATHARSEEHTSELQSLMRISYAVFCLKKKKTTTHTTKSQVKHYAINNRSKKSKHNKKNTSRSDI